ncbi:MAG: hypothetical protein HKN76_07205, partial [Saprospiraceae bacterium]|nr:hypothetical protein [Saprospiraceae bacterium]
MKIQPLFISQFASLIFGIILVQGCQQNIDQPYPYRTWSHYNGDKMGSKYSALDQINRNNVRDLKIKWKFNTGDLPESAYSNMECNPLIIDHVVYLTSPTIAVIAVDGPSGTELWRYETHPGLKNRGTSRGLAYWEKNDTTRLFFSKGNYLYCLDAQEGELISTFGQE